MVKIDMEDIGIMIGHQDNNKNIIMKMKWKMKRKMRI